MARIPDFEGKDVTVIGLGIEGEDLARYFIGRGARVTVSDSKSREALGVRASELELKGARLSLGRNDPAAIEGADLVCVSQGVPLSNAAVRAAVDSGRKVESMTSLFLQWWPGPIVGITGSSGKTTTTSLVDSIFSVAGQKHVLGGNIGLGLMSLLDGAAPGVRAVLEISHTQLSLVKSSPGVAALLNVTPNHLDQFTWDEYVELKSRIFAYQSESDKCVFNAEDAVSQKLRTKAKARGQLLFGIAADHGGEGAFVAGGQLMLRKDGQSERVIGVDQIPLRGRHNLANVAAATAIAGACEIDIAAIGEAVRTFRAPPHRIELVGTVEDVSYYDDSIATTPERTLAALRSFEERIVLLLGGRDKHLPLEELALEAGRRCRAVVCFGEARELLSQGMSGSKLPVEIVERLEEGIEAARKLAQPGDVVLLSPACTSFDAYANFERRGDHFKELVRTMTVTGATR